MSRLKRSVMGGIVALLLGIMGCGEPGTGPGPGPTPVATIVLTPPSATLEISQSITFTAEPRDAQGKPVTGRAVTWTSSNQTVATVAAGVVTGIAVGQTTISASTDGKVGTASVTVVGSSPPATPIYFEDRADGGIYRINPDGTGLTFVVSGRAPALASTGNRLAFLWASISALQTRMVRTKLR